MKKKFLIIFVFLLILVSFQRVEAAHKTEYMSAFLATIKYIPKGNFEIDSMDERYYSQVYEVYVDNVEIIDYKIEELNNFPEGSFVADVNTGSNRDTFDRKMLKFKIMVPVEKVTEDFLGKIKVYMNFYGLIHTKNNNGELKVDKVKSANEQIKVLDNRHSSLVLNFTDKDTLEGMEGIEAEIKDTTFEEAKVIKSDANGKMYINKIGEGCADVNIRNFPTNYNIEKLEYLVEIGYNKEVEYNIFLEHQKGDLYIKDNIENAVFEIYDSKGILIREIYK